MEAEPLLDGNLLLERFPGKGGWTYARIPEIAASKRNHFGWQKVCGYIDGFEIKQCHLMPLGKGQLMIAVKAAIRKAIKKEAGDWVNLVLYSLEKPLPLPEDFQLCLEDEPSALQAFRALPDMSKRECLDWIYAVKSETLIVERMALAINRLVKGQPVLPEKQ